MAIKPIVRYMLLCEDWELDPQNNRRLNIFGLISNIRSLEQPPYPLLYREMCVILALTAGRGMGTATINCIFEETGATMIVGVPFRIRNFEFPKAGLYSVQFLYEGELVDERPLRMR